MHISILTIFPELFNNFWKKGMVGKAVKMGKLFYSLYSIRDFVFNKHRSIDDRPYGGGCGMIMKPDPIISAIKVAKKRTLSSTIFLSPKGRKLNQNLLFELSGLDEIVFICGRYEGIDERVIESYVDLEVSIGDYIVSGGEIPAMVLVDAIVRLIPGVLRNPKSSNNDTFSNGMLEYSQYTRPREFDGKKVPNVLFSGNHKAIKEWRFENSLLSTLLKRKDLLMAKPLTSIEIETLNRWRSDIEDIIQKQSLFSFDSSSSS